MKVEDQLRKSLLNFPMLFPNALTVYDHLFLVIGNGFEWKDGELVHSGEENKRFTNMTIKDAVLALLQEDIVDDWRNEYSVVRSFAKVYEPLDDFTFNYIARHGEDVIESVKKIFDIENRLKDFSIPTNKTFTNTEYKFYGLYNYSLITSIPDDVKNDWLKAAKRMIEILEENPDRFEDSEGLFKQVKERVESIYNKRYNTIVDYDGEYDIVGKDTEEVGAGCHSWFQDVYVCRNHKNGRTRNFDEFDIDKRRLINQ